MGCCKSRTIYSTTSAENSELIRFETSFGLYKIPFRDLEAVCRRSTSASLSRLVSLVISSFSLSIPHSLIENSTHSEFLIYLILSGKGTSKDKVSALWYLFDSNLENQLSKDLFLKLVRSIIKASTSIPLQAYLKITQSALITTWNQQLSDRSEGLEQKLIKHFLDEADSISFDVFLAKCEEMPNGRIWEAAALRTQLEHTHVIPKKFANPFRTMKVTKLTS